jgi:hypothetical protein
LRRKQTAAERLETGRGESAEHVRRVQEEAVFAAGRHCAADGARIQAGDVWATAVIGERKRVKLVQVECAL